MRKLAVEELGRLSIQAYRQAPKYPLHLALDDVRSRYNVGSLLRSADAFRVEKVLLGGYTPVPPHPEIYRAALGAEESVAWERIPHLAAHLKNLREKGFAIIALEQTDESQNLMRFDWPPPPWVLVVGHEIRGLSEEVLAVCTHAVEIPQYGTKHSLNVAVAGGIALYEAVRALEHQGFRIA